MLSACPATPRAPVEAPAAAPSFACADAAQLPPEGLKRLTSTQYRNTMRDLTRWALGREPDSAIDREVIAALALLDEMPDDQRTQGGYRRLDQALDQRHVDGAFAVGSALGAALAQPAQLERIAGACATDLDPNNDAACFSAFMQRFGTRALRRPVDAENELFYREVGSYADVITVLLNAPELLYFVEHAEAAVPERTGTFALSSYELASRLSYHFWQTLPDEPLWNAAQDGSLLTPEGLSAQVDRLLDDPRSRATIAELYSDWLGLEDLPQLDAHDLDPLYAAFAGDDLPGPELRQHMIDEVLDMLAHYTWDEPAGVAALLTSERSFARTDDLARIYGIGPWDGVSAPPLLPANERPGVLTRAALLATGSPSTRPIMKGVLIRRRVLCDELLPPPANVNAVPPALRADMTTRQVVEQLTEQPGSACAGCHATQINPLGFAFEGFDALGRARVEQLLFDDAGQPLGALPIDTSSVPRITADDESVSSGPVELMQRIVHSGKVEACLARHYFRFTFGRQEHLARDGCALERLRTRLVETGTLRDMLREAALLPELRERTFDEGTL